MRGAAVRWLAVLLALSAGCGRERAGESLESTSLAGTLLGPASRFTRGSLFAPARRLFPLAVGNVWEYTTRFASTVIADTGPQPPELFERRFRAVIIGTERHGERTYFLYAELVPFADQPRAEVLAVDSLSQSITRMRQDAGGLFVLEVSPFESGGSATARGDRAAEAREALERCVDRTPATAAHREAFRRAAAEAAAKLAAVTRGAALAPEPEPGEASLLRYPLQVGLRWIAQEHPRVERQVVARERVRVPFGVAGAWRIEVISDHFDQDDRVTNWYGSAGLLRQSARIVTNALDDHGRIIGRLVFDSDQVLTAAQLASPGLAGTPASVSESGSNGE